MCPKANDQSPFDADRIAEHLSLLGLNGRKNQDYAAELQSQVVQPNVTAIVENFYAALIQFDEVKAVIRCETDALKLKGMHDRYLSTLAVGFQHQEYFEDRFRIGLVHERVGVSLRLYQCTYSLLQSLLIDYIPQKIRDDQSAYDQLVQFILKITALDMSLAIEAYHVDKVSFLERTVDAVRSEGQQLRMQLITDALTGLNSRAFSLDSLVTALESASSEARPLCVLMADIDHFKNINDKLGHRVGDHALHDLASRMVAGARKIDMIGRYGGDEFLFILRDTDLDSGKEIAERIRLKVNEHPLHVGDSIVRVTLSLGIALARDDDDVNSLIERADQALYTAKLKGRDCVCVEAAELNTASGL